MSWKNIKLVLFREVRDQLRDRRTLFMITILPVLLYPMLGLGVVEMLLTFSEQQRVVVVLNADDLPQNPRLLDDAGILPEWTEDCENPASAFHVVAEQSSRAGVTVAQDRRPDQDRAEKAGDSKHRRRRGKKSDQELLTAARSLAAELAQLQVISSAGESADRMPASVAGRDILTEEIHGRLAGLLDQVNVNFTESGIHVLMIVPEGYAESLEILRAHVRYRTVASSDATSLPPVLVVRNSADDKSAVAFAEVRDALQNWETAVRDSVFKSAGLPTTLQQPARLEWIEVAREDQVAASVWSRLFPALLVIMALTGAFYPAIDLGAGEKERGTMETLLISPARRVELVLGKFLTIMLFSVATAVLNLVSMGFTGQQMAAVLGDGISDKVSLDFPGLVPLLWLLILLLPLSALFSALCLALATFARSTKEGQYYLTPVLMVVMGLTIFCLSPSVEMTPLYSMIPVLNIALLLKSQLLNSPASGDLAVYAIPVIISSLGYSVLALWWAIELYNSEDVLFREAEKFDLRSWCRQLLRTKDAVPALPEATFCFILILLLQFTAMTYMKPDLNTPDPGSAMMRLIVVQQLTTVACPAVFMGLLLTTSLRATFRLRCPSLRSMALGIGLALVAHPLSVELSQFLVDHQVFPELPESARQVMTIIRNGEPPVWLLLIVFAVTPAICEELAFRGFILSGLARGGRLVIAVGMSSLMFGIIHMIPQQAFNAALLGLLLGLLAVYSRSLLPAIAFHFCNNAAAMFQAVAPSSFGVDGVFFVRDADGILRYETPLLILCAVAVLLMVRHMIRFIASEQDLKRRGLIRQYDAAPELAPVPATTSHLELARPRTSEHPA